MSSGTPDEPADRPRHEVIAWKPGTWPSDPAGREVVARLLTRDVTREDFAFETDFRGGDFDGAPFARVWFGLSSFSGVSLRGADLDVAHLDGTDLRGADLSGVRAHEATFVEVDATGASFRGAKVTGITGRHGVFATADFRGATLSGASFHGADLRGADWRGASARLVFLTGARVEGMSVAGFSGEVVGPVDVGPGEGGHPVLLGGVELAQWFTSRGADVHVRSPQVS